MESLVEADGTILAFCTLKVWSIGHVGTHQQWAVNAVFNLPDNLSELPEADKSQINPTGRSPNFNRWGGVHIIHYIGDWYIVVPHWDLIIKLNLGHVNNFDEFKRLIAERSLPTVIANWHRIRMSDEEARKFALWILEAARYERTQDIPPCPI